MRRRIAAWERSSEAAAGQDARQRKLRDLVTFANEHVPFYRDLYRESGFRVDQWRGIPEWHRVPIIRKRDLHQMPLSARSADVGRGTKVNTGGTSGEPLEFLIDSGSWAREWAHMHHIWEAKGYRRHHLKITFRGKKGAPSEPLRYNAVHNEFVVNASSPMHQVVDAVLQLSKTEMIRWIHGYPSLVADFAAALYDRGPQSVSSVQRHLHGVLLGSEYPAPPYRETIEDVLSCNIVTWYGHSEMAAIAKETSRGVYQSFPTYGLVEAVPSRHSGGFRLVATSLYNRVHPFIRYDTGDRIDPIETGGGALRFRISDGRTGDFIIDHSGERKALTAMIFGRHHSAFAVLRHVQVRDEGGGRISLVVTPRDPSLELERVREGFDLDDFDVDWRVEIVDEPVRSASGKIRLKIE